MSELPCDCGLRLWDACDCGRNQDVPRKRRQKAPEGECKTCDRERDASYIARHIRAAVIDRDGHICAYCGVEVDVPHLDHILPRSRGGKNTLENLTVACVPCNQSKSWKTPEEWKGRP